MAIYIGWISGTHDPPAILAKAAAAANIAVSHYRDLSRDARKCDLIVTNNKFSQLETMCRNRLSNDGVPIIVLGKLESGERARWIKAGADDAVHLDWCAGELTARMKTAIRRAQFSGGLWSYGPLAFNLLERTVRYYGSSIRFNTREYNLLLYLAKARGEVVLREELLKNVWQIDFDPGTNRIDVYIFRLRDKLRQGSGTDIVETVRGKGYRIKPW